MPSFFSRFVYLCLFSSQELRLHTSGLPPQAPNHDLAGGDGNPFAGYTEEMMCDALLKLTGLPARGRFVYSNFAYGMLGYALAKAATKPGQPQMTYEDVIRMTVLDNLGMNNTSVTLDESGWEKAAKGCDRGIHRANYAIRRGEYGVLQGNGALRSTLPDMSKFLSASLRTFGGYTDLDPTSDTVQEAIKKLGDDSTEMAEACTCVSGWCEGNLCPLPNPVKERITDSGSTIYTSGGIIGRRKSGGKAVVSVWFLIHACISGILALTVARWLFQTRKATLFVVPGASKNDGLYLLWKRVEDVGNVGRLEVRPREWPCCWRTVHHPRRTKVRYAQTNETQFTSLWASQTVIYILLMSILQWRYEVNQEGPQSLALPVLMVLGAPPKQERSKVVGSLTLLFSMDVVLAVTIHWRP